MTLPEKHFNETKNLLKEINIEKIATWLLNSGYFPEQYVLPPTFEVSDFRKNENIYIRDLNDLPRRKIINVSYPKSLLTSRVFGIQHPHNYHDIVYWMIKDWSIIINHIFHSDINIFTYSFPIPVNARSKGELSSLRSGRMIYEWLEMAERDLVAEAHKYQLIIRADITNFYNSVYTHSIGWALHGRETAFADKNYKLTGNKIDRLVQYANDGRTNGIPVGSAVSDLIAEIILASIDRNVSIKIKGQNINLLGTRFKDDYRLLCNSEEDAKKILKILSKELINFNLLINESKTQILHLPEGLYRQHDRDYFQYSLTKMKKIPFKNFELTLLKVLDIHRKYPDTSLIEKFFGELFDHKYDLKIVFSSYSKTRIKQILKTFSLLFLLKRESEKILCHVMAIIEDIYNRYKREFKLKEYLKELITLEIKNANFRKSEFELIWFIFFSRYLKLGIIFSEIIDSDLRKNLFLKSILESKQKIFADSDVQLFKKPTECGEVKMAKRLAVFNRNKEN